MLLKILFVNGHLHIGGVEKSLVNLLKAIDYSQHQVDLLLVEDLGELREEIPSPVRVFYCDLKPTYGSVQNVLSKAFSEKDSALASQKIALSLANKIDKRFLQMLKLPEGLEKEYDSAIAYRVGLPLDLISFSIRANVKCAWWHHGEFDYPESFVRSWTAAFQRIDHIVCVSEPSKRMIEPYFPGLEQKMCVLPNMVIPDEIWQAADAFDPYEKETTKRILVSVGRMSPEKHMADAVDVMYRLKDKGFDDLVWYLVGDGAERQMIERKICEHGLMGQFRLVGNQANPYPYVKHADVFVHPSWVESQGISVLEAMVLEKLCVVVKSAGTEEFIADGCNALQAEQSTDNLTARIIDALTLFPADKLRARATETADAYCPETIMPRLIHLLSR